MDNFEDFEMAIMEGIESGRFGTATGNAVDQLPPSYEEIRTAMLDAEERLRIMQQTMSFEEQLRELHGEFALEGIEELRRAHGMVHPIREEPEEKMSDEDAYIHRLGL
jgi:hypothetical protein